MRPFMPTRSASTLISVSTSQIGCSKWMIRVLPAGHADTVNGHIGQLVAMIGRVNLPIERNWRGPVDLNPAGHDDPFLIGPAPHNLEAFTTEGGEGGRIADGDVIRVKFDEL